ncbi:MAG TPA: hypothetical protein VGO47_10685, partial [Chlamydiales bacterium]|nr:hypothetical protein [Chlamydiales bacterium]
MPVPTLSCSVTLDDASPYLDAAVLSFVQTTPFSEMPETTQKDGGGDGPNVQIVVKSRKNTLRVSPVGSEEWNRHPDIYMADGTMVLLADNVVFKVYPGLLALHS